MSQRIYPIRLSRQDRRLFAQAARAEAKSMAEWLRVAGRERANGSRKSAACLDYSDSIVLSARAERDPKGFIRAKLKARS